MGFLLVLLAALTASASCYTASTETRTWTAPPPGADWARPGHVESVQEIVEHVQGNPAGGALAGALIGGFLFHGRGPATLFGAATGAAVGAAASQGAAYRRHYQVLVRFDDDGGFGMFVYRDYSPFGPGDAVLLTPRGLVRR